MSGFANGKCGSSPVGNLRWIADALAHNTVGAWFVVFELSLMLRSTDRRYDAVDGDVEVFFEFMPP